ncbi:MAG: hypothetical protein PGN23_12625 [Sphingomonas adhaesiva]|uniref:hypothetical protein n=1 Tax=Sphingomonas adhaesiva TaxID=28212 RepID=UPI002FF8A5AA
MTKRQGKDSDAGKRRAKGAAYETIGKLIGDDAAVDAGRRAQRAADRDDPSRNIKKQE